MECSVGSTDTRLTAKSNQDSTSTAVQLVSAGFVLVRLGETIMDSAFARTLRGGIKGVAMVLDHEVQPLTRALPLKRAFTLSFKGFKNGLHGVRLCLFWRTSST